LRLLDLRPAPLVARFEDAGGLAATRPVFKRWCAFLGFGCRFQLDPARRSGCLVWREW